MYTVNQVTIVPKGELTFQQIFCENIINQVIDLCNDLYQNNFISYDGIIFSTTESLNEARYSTIVCRNRVHDDKLIIFVGHEYEMKEFLPRVHEINMDYYEKNIINKLVSNTAVLLSNCGTISESFREMAFAFSAVSIDIPV